MEASTFLMLVAIVLAILATICIIIVVKTKFRTFFAVSQIIILMLVIMVLTVGSISCTILDYDNGERVLSVEEAIPNSDGNSFSVITDNNYVDNDVKLFVFSDEIEQTKLIINSRVKIRTLFGYPLYIKKNVLVARPKLDTDNMSNSRKKSYIDDLNNRRYLLW